MRVLFDQGTPVPLRKYLSAHEVVTTFELGWDALTNGDLLLQADREGFQVLVTTDQNLKYQQELSSRMIAIVVITTTSWPRIQQFVADVVFTVESATPSSYAEIPRLNNN